MDSIREKQSSGMKWIFKHFPWEKGISAWDDFNIETEDDIFIDTDFLICYFCMCVRPFKCVGGLRANDPLENVLPRGGREEPNKSLHVCL